MREFDPTALLVLKTDKELKIPIIKIVETMKDKEKKIEVDFVNTLN